MAPRTIEANKHIKDNRKSQILLAALKLFTRKGYTATKMSDISDLLGTSYGLVYHYFQSKEDVYAELLEYAIHSIGNMIEEIRRSYNEPLLQIQNIICRVLKSVETEEASAYYYILVMNALVYETPPLSREAMMREAMASLSEIGDIIAAGQAAGQIRDGSPIDLALTCFSTIIGIASLKVSDFIQKTPDPDLLMRLFQKNE